MLHHQQLKQQARERVAAAQQEKKIVLRYAGILAAVSVAAMAIELIIDSLTPQTGGLSTIGLRSFLSSLTTILPVLTSLLSLCLGFGYMGGMVRISRGQYASPNVLRTGFERFWPLLRLSVLRGILVVGMSIAACYLASFAFLFSPFSDKFVELATPVISNGSLLSEGSIVMDSGMADAILNASLPMFLFLLLALLLLVVPLLYRLRMADYVLYDHPEVGALYAIRESRNMMRGNRLALLKLDLSFWWYYLLYALCVCVPYAPLLLSLIGVEPPMSETVSSLVFFLLACAGEFAVTYYLRNQVEVTYALVYNHWKPQETSGGAVLGNIFQM